MESDLKPYAFFSFAMVVYLLALGGLLSVRPYLIGSWLSAILGAATVAGLHVIVGLAALKFLTRASSARARYGGWIVGLHHLSVGIADALAAYYDLLGVRSVASIIAHWAYGASVLVLAAGYGLVIWAATPIVREVLRRSVIESVDELFLFFLWLGMMDAVEASWSSILSEYALRYTLSSSSLWWIGVAGLAWLIHGVILSAAKDLEVSSGVPAGISGSASPGSPEGVEVV